MFLFNLGATGDVNETFVDGEFINYGNEEAWILYSPNRGFDTPSNNHNLVILSNTSELRNDLENEVNNGWDKADGAKRYAYIGEEWSLEDYQLEKGHYFTTRYHLRGYKASNMTLIQAHYEHFDWFSLTHEVESNVAAREFLVNGLKDEGFEVEMVRSEKNRFLDSDGWITLAILISFFATLSKSGYNKEILNYTIPLTGFIGLFALLRFGSISLYSVLNPHQIFALMYPIILVGMPLLAYFSVRDIDGLLSGILVFSGFILAVLLDYFYLGVETVPFEIVVNRFSAALSLAIIAYGSNTSNNRKSALITGIGLWIVTLIAALILI